MSGGAGPPLSLVGPTAAGKSRVALDLARRWSEVELVSVDSMQVYRGMDIGTAKPSDAERAEVRHHLVDVLDPWEDFDVAQFQSMALHVLAEVAGRGHRALLVGGTGLYHRAVIDGFTIPGRFPEVRAGLEDEPDTAALHRRLIELDPVAAGRMEPNNRRRVLRALEVTLGTGQPFSSAGPGLDRYPATGVAQVGLAVDPTALAERIEVRFRSMLDGGLLDEVRGLEEVLALAGRTWSRTASQALGYRELLAHLRGGVTLDEAADVAIRRTRRFARRQRSWFRRDPRVAWIDVSAGAGEAPPELVRRVARLWGPPDT